MCFSSLRRFSRIVAHFNQLLHTSIATLSIFEKCRVLLNSGQTGLENYLSMYDSRDGVSESVSSPSPPSSLTYVRWCFWVQAYYSFYPRNPVYARRLDSSVLVISLSFHRHPFVCILFSSRFTCYNNKSGFECTSARHGDTSALTFSLSSHRHSYIPLIFGSRFIDS